MSELKRLLDEPGSELDRLLLESALEDEPESGSADRTLAALGLGGAAAGAVALSGGAVGAGTGAAASGLATKSVAFGVTLKWAAAVTVAGALVGGGIALTRSPEPAFGPRPVEISQQERAALASEGGRPRSFAESASPLGGSEGATANGRAADGAPRAPRSDAGRPAARAIAGSTSVAEERSPERPAQGKGATAKPASAAKPGAGQTSELLDADELEIMDQARRALIDGKYDACLARLSAYQSRFPRGQLAAEAANMRRSVEQKKLAEQKKQAGEVP